VSFVVDNVALEYIFLQVLKIFPANTFPPVLHTHLYVHVAATEGQTDEACEPSKKQGSVVKRRGIDRKMLSLSDNEKKNVKLIN
jgi:hypothetical protein